MTLGLHAEELCVSLQSCINTITCALLNTNNILFCTSLYKIAMILGDTVSLKAINKKHILVLSFKINSQRPVYCDVSSMWLNYTREAAHLVLVKRAAHWDMLPIVKKTFS